MATEIKFGTDGFRGIIADTFTFENVKRITNALILYLFETAPAENTILLGYDPRFMADKFASFCAELLKQAGFRVLMSSCVVPTPVLAYQATVQPSCAGAVMFTASHNPKEYLGIKFIPNYGGPANKEITDRIVSLIDKQCPESAHKGKSGGEIVKRDFRKEYFEHLEKIIDFDIIEKGGVKFIYDGLFSASVGYFDTLLKSRKVEFEGVNLRYDPDFGGNLPEPKPKFMKVKKEGYITFANDGDADRYGVLDETGSYVSPDIVMAILLKYLVSKGAKGKMIKTVGVSTLIDIVAKKLQIQTITTPVGFKWLSEKMRTNETILAGEDSGGLSTGVHIPEKDGIYANLLILEAVSALNKPLYRLKEEILEFAGTSFVRDRVDIKLQKEEEKQKLCREFAVLDNIAGFKISDTVKIDGVKFYLADNDGKNAGWVLVRESGTEPLLRFYIEAVSKNALDSIKNFIENFV